MPLDSIRAWLGLAPAATESPVAAALRDLVETLEHLEPARARYVARFAYLLGRIARADQHVSAEESRAMEALLVKEGGLTPEQALMVAGLAKASHLMFGSTADFEVAREFAASATSDEKLALVRCLFAVASVDAAISVAEESEIHRIANHFKVLPHDLMALRVAHATVLPGVASRRQPS